MLYALFLFWSVSPMKETLEPNFGRLLVPKTGFKVYPMGLADQNSNNAWTLTHSLTRPPALTCSCTHTSGLAALVFGFLLLFFGPWNVSTRLLITRGDREASFHATSQNLQIAGRRCNTTGRDSPCKPCFSGCSEVVSLNAWGSIVVQRS